ncbi:flagellar motor protein MotB [Aliifodinibius sp. S!AR15-10]|uniref:OmpA/MotB family protein n=1 Tax=Aliifodinibius sp. S!AR15-10 TaxID=2950437 RepID=UPI002859F042|nr:flagellar motor protein MotB [Aliifodinibius sp. S!AR15-10]MDR8394247.1 flagellar motor protein MotB [Aliifodinibius sp. S!AR15-10]
MGDSEEGTGTWLMTYSDLVTLLLVFFVLLYTLTPGIKDANFNDFISYFQSSDGIIDQTAAVNTQSSSNSLQEEWETIKKFLEDQGLSSEVDINRIAEGIKVTLSDSVTFNSGSAQLLPEARLVLGEMSEIFDDDIQSIKVQGHTDNVPISESSKYLSNWHLGAARAVSVVLFINDHSKLEASRFEASSFGKYRPVASNDTPEGRRENRRVEIYVQYKDDTDPSSEENWAEGPTNFVPQKTR